jgi:phosphatidylglycerol:prolipoprotein diacylglycerol transferase
MYISRRYKERLLEGDVFCLYLIWYPFGRFFIEALRPDAWLIGGIPAAQIFSAIILLASIMVMVYRHKRSKSESNYQ